METIENLHAKINDLEKELQELKSQNIPMRQKIEQMSSEVVDTNPYRFLYSIILKKYFSFNLPIQIFLFILVDS